MNGCMDAVAAALEVIIRQMKGFKMSEDSNLPDEMSALIEAAVSMHEMFITLITAGFTEAQALTLVGQLLRPQNNV